MGDRDNARNLATQLRDWLRVLRERAWLILFCVLVSVVAATAYSNLRDPVYAATSRLLLEEESTNAYFTSDANQFVDPARRAATNLELVSLPALGTRVVRELSLPYSPETLVKKVKAESQGDSNLISVTVEDNDPRMAARIANTLATEYVAFRQEADRRRFGKALALVQAQIARRQASNSPDPAELKALNNQAEQLQLLVSVQTGGAEPIQSARPPSEPIRPKKVRNALLGLIFGLLVGVTLATLRDRLDRRLKTPDDIRELMPEVPIIASVPRLGSTPRGRMLTVEAYRTLQTNLSFLNVERRLSSFLVTSAMLGDGKSTTSLALAWTMVERGNSALLVEADLRRPGLSERLELWGSPGVSNFLSGGRPFEDFLLDVTERSTEVLLGGRPNGDDPAIAGGLRIIPAGPIPPNPQALLNGPGLDELLEQADANADTVVVDGTPVGSFSDMLPVAKRVDGVIIVARLYYTRRPEMQRLLDQLRQADVQPIGIVLLGAQVSRADDYYTASYERRVPAPH